MLAPGGVSRLLATVREALRTARAALDTVMVARETASMSSADPERIAHVLVLELRRESRRIDGEVPIGFVMLADDDAGQDTLQIDAHEHRDRPSIAALEGNELCRPEGIAKDGLWAWRAGISGEMRRLAFLGRERRRARKQDLESGLLLGRDGGGLPAGEHQRSGANEQRDDHDGSRMGHGMLSGHYISAVVDSLEEGGALHAGSGVPARRSRRLRPTAAVGSRSTTRTRPR